MLNDIFIHKKIGSGLNVSAYLVEDSHKNKLCLRRQKVLKTDLKNQQNNPIWRELLFYKFIDNLPQSNKAFFMQSYDYKFYKCNFKWSIPPNMKQSKLLLALEKSPYCLDVLTDLKDGTLKELIKYKNRCKFNLQQKYSMLIQFIYALHILHTNNYSHYDNNSGNICYVKCKPDSQILLTNIDKSVKSYGYQFSIIDYTGMTELNTDTNPDLQTYNMDLHIFITKCLLRISLKDYNIKDSFAAYRQISHYVYTRERLLYNKIKKHILLLWPHLSDNFIRLEILYDYANTHNKPYQPSKIYDSRSKIFILENEIAQYVGIYNKKLFCRILNIKFFNNLIMKKHIIYIKQNYNNLTKIIEYFIDLLNG